MPDRTADWRYTSRRFGRRERSNASHRRWEGGIFPAGAPHWRKVAMDAAGSISVLLVAGGQIADGRVRLWWATDLTGAGCSGSPSSKYWIPIPIAPMLTGVLRSRPAVSARHCYIAQPPGARRAASDSNSDSLGAEELIRCVLCTYTLAAGRHPDTPTAGDINKTASAKPDGKRQITHK